VPVLLPNEKVIEPFCGTAPALEVARSYDYRYWGCDISPDAINHATSRNKQMRLG